MPKNTEPKAKVETVPVAQFEALRSQYLEACAQLGQKDVYIAFLERNQK